MSLSNCCCRDVLVLLFCGLLCVTIRKDALQRVVEADGGACESH
jgi:hypothetical protein